MPWDPAREDGSSPPGRWIALALFVGSFTLYALTISRTFWTTDVIGADWTSWHIAATGSPWVDGAVIPEVGHRSRTLLAIVGTSNGHTAFGRFPGVVAASLPAYLLDSGSMSTVPASLTAAFMTALALTLMFLALRRHLGLKRALAAVLILGFATPVWTISANLMWPQTVTILGIAGVSWAAASDRWWWTGFFGGVTLWGRVHAALIIACVGIGVGTSRRQPRLVVDTAGPSLIALLASCVWIHWIYGTWSPLGDYDAGAVGANVAQYRFSVVNQLGTWVAPDRGILVWTPVTLVLLPALVRSWRTLPDWSRSMLVGGLFYTFVGGAMNTFTGGDGFYGYRYGLELLICATPALALSHTRMGRLARAMFGPLVALQFFAILLGALNENLYLSQSVAWSRNAFVHALNAMGPPGWATAAFVVLAGGLVAWRLEHGGSTGEAVADSRRVADRLSA